MSNVKVPFTQENADTATLLLAAAEKKGLDASVVRTAGGAFMVPQEVADEAGVEYEGSESKPAKKATAKKSSAKKAAKKSSSSKDKE